jgi:hypothetical protein
VSCQHLIGIIQKRSSEVAVTHTKECGGKKEQGHHGDGVHRHGFSLRPTGDAFHGDGGSMAVLGKDAAYLQAS